MSRLTRLKVNSAPFLLIAPLFLLVNVLKTKPNGLLPGSDDHAIVRLIYGLRLKHTETSESGMELKTTENQDRQTAESDLYKTNTSHSAHHLQQKVSLPDCTHRIQVLKKRKSKIVI